MYDDTPSSDASSVTSDPAIAVAAEWMMRQRPALRDKSKVRTALWRELPELQLTGGGALLNGAMGRLVDAMYAEGYRAQTFMTAARNHLHTGHPAEAKILLHEPLYGRLQGEGVDPEDPAYKRFEETAQAVVLLSHYLGSGYGHRADRALCTRALNRYCNEVAGFLPRTVARRGQAPLQGIDLACSKVADEVGEMRQAMAGTPTPWREMPENKLQNNARQPMGEKCPLMRDALAALTELGYPVDTKAVRGSIERTLGRMNEAERSMFRQLTQDLAVVYREQHSNEATITPLHRSLLPAVIQVRGSQLAYLLNIAHPEPAVVERQRRDAERKLGSLTAPSRSI